MQSQFRLHLFCISGYGFGSNLLGNHAFFIVEEFVLEFGFLNIVHMCLSAQGVKLSGLLISPLMRPVICGKQHRGLVEGLSATIKRHRSLLLSK